MDKQTEISTDRAVVQALESLQAAGVQQLPQSQLVAEAILPEPAPQQPSPQPEELQSAPVQDLQADTRSSEEISTAPTLEVLQQEVAECTLCDDLASTRTQTVFGVGNPDARLCILGEAPGADEDRLGEPFVGRGGQLLNKILAACKLERSDVYIMNILRCRPPGNRNPSEREAQNCRRFLERQIQLVDPEFICCMGTVPAQNLLSTRTTIGRLRGQVHEYRGIKVVCTYHPAYLLRNPSAKKHTWDDMKMLLREMGTPVE